MIESFQRIENHMNFSEINLRTIKIFSELMKNVKKSYRHYQDKLENQRNQKQESQKSLKNQCTKRIS